MAAYYGIFRSNNDFCKLIGLFIIFRWVISFVDEPNGWVCSNIMLYFSWVFVSIRKLETVMMNLCKVI